MIYQCDPVSLGILDPCVRLMDVITKKTKSLQLEVGQHFMQSCLIQTAIKYLKVLEESFCTTTYMVVLKTYVKRFALMK